MACLLYPTCMTNTQTVIYDFILQIECPKLYYLILLLFILKITGLINVLL